ncbi:MAG TPA: citrate synthase/methylcitrate synthase [Thermoanaerobaculia bacterium]|jgi:citrate synthase|nr:citrate synthase/methylcitrate synthase [Thermoanaerobaculia bacterium]
MNENTTIHNGLEGIIAAETSLSMVDGTAGELVIAGFPVAELAMNATFEETAHLLWYGTLPDQDELNAFRADLARRRELPPVAYELLRAAAYEKADGMDALRMAAGTISLRGDSRGTDKSVCATSASATGASGASHREQCGTDTLVCAADDDAARNLLATFPTIVAAYWRFLNDRAPIAPRADLGHAANFLYLLSGVTPSDERVRGLETYLNTVVDHGLNASTFTARVIASTNSDLVSAITGAIGALKGPLHGGAPGPALDMVFAIGAAERAEGVLREKIESGEKLMGFGHRVYKVRDPRADVLAAAAERMFTRGGDMALYDLARAVESVALRLLEEYKPGRNLQTNVEFYTALLLHGLDLEVPLFTPTFAISRVAGWIAHCFEQRRANRIIRPQSVYRGSRDLRWRSADERKPQSKPQSKPTVANLVSS